MLESLGLSGYQSFRYEQRARLAPLTLVFGPNSSGKTAILRALRMLDQSLTAGGEVTYNGDLVQLGSFGSTVFRGEVEQEISLSFSANFSNLPVSYFEGLRRRFMKGFSHTPISQSAEITLHLDSDSPVPKRVQITGRVGLLNPLGGGGGESSSRRKASEVEFETLHSVHIILDLKKRGGVNSVCAKFDISDVEIFQSALEGIDDLPGLLKVHLPDFVFHSGRNFVPSRVMRLMTEGEDARRAQQFCEGFLRFFGELLKPPMTNNVGPVRKEIPATPLLSDRSGSDTSALLSDASNLVDYLFALPGHVAQRGAQWLRRITDGRFGYQLARMSSDYVVEGESGWAFAQSPVGQFMFQDFHNKTLVSPSNSGSGLTQVLPVLVSLLTPPKPGRPSGAPSERGRVALIEQPELHLHPAMQAELVDVFVNSVKNSDDAGFRAQIIAETHSESMLLRVQKLVREGQLDPSEVSLLFVDQFPEVQDSSEESGATGSYVQEIRLAKDGTFRDRWPLSFSDVRWSEID